jgi:hypothetical protein
MVFSIRAETESLIRAETISPIAEEIESSMRSSIA